MSSRDRSGAGASSGQEEQRHSQRPQHRSIHVPTARQITRHAALIGSRLREAPRQESPHQGLTSCRCLVDGPLLRPRRPVFRDGRGDFARSRDRPP